MIIASMATNPYEMRAPKDLETIFQQLGMHPEETRKAVENK